ncbi:MAG TPA: TIM barrel protein [Candidatus Pygmaiobacter gallistercoris]|nr:TIM barrel protein [Candidatus Pygmaiobacter gallistercoris]
MNEIRFGTAGVAEDFKTLGYKNSFGVPEYLSDYGLNAFEYQCGRGVRLSEESGKKLGALGAAKDIRFSVHAPYYISMSSMEEDKRIGSVRYLLESAAAVRSLGGKRVIFHSGSCGKQSREAALEKALDTMRRAVEAMDEQGFSDIVLCPETMGKINQLGTLDEVLALCKVDDRILPCIDFGHLNARTLGGLATKADFAAVLDRMEEVLQDDRARNFHVHFSKIEYTKGGEKCHLTFADTTFGPDYEPFLELCCQRGLTPTVICESAGTQAADARTMMRYYQSLAGKE